jgi:hypothetical protein
MLAAIFQFHYLAAHLGIILFKKIELVLDLVTYFSSLLNQSWEEIIGISKMCCDLTLFLFLVC